MLNKLSFNLMNELNESETKKFKIKKKVFMEGSSVRKEIITEDASSALEKVKAGDEVYFRDSEGQAMMIKYTENYPEPDEYDEGYKEEYGGSADELAYAKQAAEEGNVWEALEVDEEGNPTGTSIALFYGEEELKRMLEDLREVKITKKLEEKALKEDDYSLARPWSTALINYCENYGVDIWEEELRSLINYLPDDTIGKYIKDMNPNGISKPEDFYPGEIDESNLNEKYSEKLGGDSEDFVSDVNTIKSTLESIDTDSFGTHLAQQMVWDWIETCDYQIDRGTRLTKGEFNECDKSLKEGFKLGEKAEIIDTCERRGQPIALVKLSKAGRYEYIVAFNYEVDSNDEVSWGYGYYYYDEESGKEAFEKVKAGGNLSESAKVEKKPIVEAAETEVKDLQVIKEQGNIYMLEDKSEGTRYIVGENYNLSEGEIENAEIYDSKEEADKDYLNRCDIIKDGEEFNTEEDSKEDNVTESDESLKQISEEEKINNLKMMDNIARKVNDEDLFYGYWLSLGVPDGATEEDYQDIAKEDYEEIEEVFKKLMNKALKDGLYNASDEELEFAKKYEPNIKNV